LLLAKQFFLNKIGKEVAMVTVLFAFTILVIGVHLVVVFTEKSVKLFILGIVVSYASTVVAFFSNNHRAIWWTKPWTWYLLIVGFCTGIVLVYTLVDLLERKLKYADGELELLCGFSICAFVLLMMSFLHFFFFAGVTFNAVLACMAAGCLNSEWGKSSISPKAYQAQNAQPAIPAIPTVPRAKKTQQKGDVKNSQEIAEEKVKLEAEKRAKKLAEAKEKLDTERYARIKAEVDADVANFLQEQKKREEALKKATQSTVKKNNGSKKEEIPPVILPKNGEKERKINRKSNYGSGITPPVWQTDGMISPDDLMKELGYE